MRLKLLTYVVCVGCFGYDEILQVNGFVVSGSNLRFRMYLVSRVQNNRVEAFNLRRLRGFFRLRRNNAPLSLQFTLPGYLVLRIQNEALATINLRCLRGLF